MVSKKEIHDLLYEQITKFEPTSDREVQGKKEALRYIGANEDLSNYNHSREHLTATGFVVQNNKVLMIYHNTLQLWCFPGGHVENNEHIYESALREVLEETAITTSLLSSNPIAQIDCINAKDHRHIDITFFCEATNTDIQRELGGPPLVCWYDASYAMQLSRERTHPVFVRADHLGLIKLSDSN